MREGGVSNMVAMSSQARPESSHPTSNGHTLHAEQPAVFDIYDFVLILWTDRAKLLIFMIAGFLGGLAVALLSTPIFRAEATLQIRAERAGAVMMEALAGQLGSLGSL